MKSPARQGNLTTSPRLNPPLTRWIFYVLLASGVLLCPNLHADVNKATREIGNSNGVKYGAKQGENWCACFATWALDLPLEKSARALYNKYPKVKEPKRGDLICFWRESRNSWKGHVGIVLEYSKDRIVTLEGNCGGKVKKCIYKENPSNLMGYVRAK
jgi:hypothetical protein